MSERHFQRARGVSSRVVDGRAVIVVMPRETLHSLNASGTVLWKAIGVEGQTRAGLRDVLTRHFRLDDTSAMSDVDRFLDQLMELGALEVSADG